MSDWSAGYLADVNYTFGYYPEMNPLRSRLAFAHAGIVAPSVATACELGFGQGVSVGIHAAASNVEWHGTDFNPAQAGFAQALVRAAESGAQLRDDAFADFFRRADLPDFDFIGLHGIFSWISEDNRAAIVDFVRRKLKVGGVLYISYNTLPGWAGFAPMRHLLATHAESLGAPGRGILDRVDGAMEFAERLLALNPAYVRAYPSLAERMKKVKGQNRNYVAHEYFNREWQPMFFSDMAARLDTAKLSFACSVNFADHVDALNLTEPQQAFLRDIPDGVLRQTVRDFMVNQQFRRDYWVKGERRLTVAERNELLQAQWFCLVTHRPDVPMKIVGALGEASLAPEIYTPLLDALADYKPKALGQLARQLQGKVGFGQLLQAAMVLAAGGHLAATQDETATARARKHTDKLNACLMDKARGGGDVSYLASPVTGGGVPVGRFQQLFLLARSQGVKQPAEWAAATWKLLAGQGQKLIKEGKALETPQENLAELNRLAKTFADKQLPILRELQVA